MNFNITEIPLSRDRAARVVTVAFNIVAPRRVAEFGHPLNPFVSDKDFSRILMCPKVRLFRFTLSSILDHAKEFK